jgi:hypothetical protein
MRRIPSPEKSDESCHPQRHSRQHHRARGRVGRLYCLGDLVGYAPFPNEVIERIQRDAIPTIMGNYDDGVGYDRDECGCAYREPEEQRLGG